MSKRKLAPPLLRGKGITLNVDDDEHLLDVVVIGKTWKPETGETAIVIGSSTGCDWLTQRGLLSAAQLLVDDTTRATFR